MPAASRFTRTRRRIGPSSSITSTRAAMPDLYPALALLSRLRQGKLEREAGTAALSRIDPDPPAHGQDEAARDEQPEPSPAVPAGAARVVELGEDSLAIGLGDAVALVDDANLDAAGAAMGLDGNRAALGGELDSVVEQ